jgi:sulfur-carrier protein
MIAKVTIPKPSNGSPFSAPQSDAKAVGQTWLTHTVNRARMRAPSSADRKEGDDEMPVKVMIPTPLRAYAGKQESVELQASTVGEALRSLTSRYQPLKQHLFADDGRLRSFVNVYVNDEDIRYLQRDQTQLKEGDTVSIVPSIAGGAPGRD